MKSDLDLLLQTNDPESSDCAAAFCCSTHLLLLQQQQQQKLQHNSSDVGESVQPSPSIHPLPDCVFSEPPESASPCMDNHV
jgi:hypothetical protein